jgi:hypothetical protein
LVVFKLTTNGKLFMSNPQSNPHTVENEQYDAHIIPSETAARAEREGENFKHTPKQDDPETKSIDTTQGYAVDSEGLVNNYAMEPEMYYEEPGDAREQLDADAAARREELADINSNDETGNLTMEGDRRGKGTGVI